MVTKKFNRKTRQMDFFVNGAFAGSAEMDIAEITRKEAELTAAAHKYAALHG